MIKVCPECGEKYGETTETCAADSTRLIAVDLNPSDPKLGTILAGRFLLVEQLGRGGMGTVYKAVHTQMDRVCAIKVLSPASGDAAAASARFKREARMASRIDNAHAVSIYDFGEAEAGELYLAMEYIEGRPLSAVLADEWPLGLDRVVDLTNQVAEALSAAHAIGIIHRDLKPDNVMVSRRGGGGDFVRVLDFGIAKTIADDGDNLTQAGLVVGTPLYMSPEQITGEKLDARSDVYSLAIIVYQMLSGRLPFDGENTQALMIKRVTSDPIPIGTVNASITPEVAHVVMSGLARRPEDRFQTVESFTSSLVGAAHGGTQIFGAQSTFDLGSHGAGRPTQAITDRDTGLSTSVDASVPDAPTLPVSSDTPGERPAPQMPTPSHFVTRPSQSAVLPDAYADQADTEGPAEQRPAEATRLVEPNAQGPRGQAVVTPATGATTGARRSNAGLLIAAVLVVGVLVVGAGGLGAYWYFFGSERDPVSETDPVPAGGDPASLDEAQIYYERGKQHQQQAYSLAEVGSAADSVEENAKAIEEYTKAIRLRPDFPEAHENLGVALYNTGQHGAALEQYRIAIEQYTAKQNEPTAQVLTNYALALFDSRRYEEAAYYFGRAIAQDTKDYDLHAHHGFALDNAGKAGEAKSAYREYLRLAPDGQYASAVRDILDGRARAPSTTGN